MRTLRVVLLAVILPALAMAWVTPHNVPEIDPASGLSALALLSGCALVFRARRVKK
jgi:uncharacterized protein (TIGR03382 family)